MVSLRNEHGFVLAVTLWILTTITLGASFFALWSNRVVVDARSNQESLSQEMAISSTRAVLLYLLATQPMGLDGLHVPSSLAKEEGDSEKSQPFTPVLRVPGPFISLADDPYYGINGTIFSVQDEGGLLGLHTIQRPVMQRLLGQLSVPSQEQGPLLDKLQDYQDLNDLHRLHGAEASAYRDKGMAAPANRFLFTSWETSSVMDWQQWSGLWADHALPRLTTVARVGTPNFNTAPAQVLQALPGIDRRIAENIVAGRGLLPFAGVADVIKAAGTVLPLDPLSFFFLPTKSQRLTLWHQGGARMREIHILLTPGAANGAPWLIDYEISMPLSKHQRQRPVAKSEIVFFQTEVSP